MMISQIFSKWFRDLGKINFTRQQRLTGMMMGTVSSGPSSPKPIYL